MESEAGWVDSSKERLGPIWKPGSGNANPGMSSACSVRWATPGLRRALHHGGAVRCTAAPR